MSDSKKLSAEECRKKLEPFVLEPGKIQFDSSEEKGHGAYGAVFEVTVNGVRCIVKRVHNALVERLQVSCRERSCVIEQFLRECVLLSDLKHPNIVHFMGVHFGRSPDDVSLVMERMSTDLGKYVENTPNVPLSIKLSILCDVSYGLVYLHDKNILHRDLTANNVLLTEDLRAKLADLGVSKLISFQEHMAIAQTLAPGSQNYMPLEALTENPNYDQKLDIFSFGHLAIYVVTQVFPKVYEVTITQGVIDQGFIQCLRRRKALDQVGGKHCLYPMIMRCLSDLPEKRPSTKELNTLMKQLTLQNPRCMHDYKQDAGQDVNTMDTSLVEEMERLRRENQELQKEIKNQKMIALTYKEDFESERKDREAVHTRIADMQNRFRCQLKALGDELQIKENDLRQMRLQKLELQMKVSSGRTEASMPEPGSGSETIDGLDKVQVQPDPAVQQHGSFHEEHIHHHGGDSNINHQLSHPDRDNETPHHASPEAQVEEQQQQAHPMAGNTVEPLADHAESYSTSSPDKNVTGTPKQGSVGPAPRTGDISKGIDAKKEQAACEDEIYVEHHHNLVRHMNLISSGNLYDSRPQPRQIGRGGSLKRPMRMYGEEQLHQQATSDDLEKYKVCHKCGMQFPKETLLKFWKHVDSHEKDKK